MKIKTNFRCQCGKEREVILKKPLPFKPTIIDAECEYCHSQWQVKYKLGKERGKVDTFYRVVKASRALQNILRTKELLKEGLNAASKFEKKEVDGDHVRQPDRDGAPEGSGALGAQPAQ